MKYTNMWATFQWHLTDLCVNRCKHCYIHGTDEIHKDNIEDEQIETVLEKLLDFEEKNNIYFLNVSIVY